MNTVTCVRCRRHIDVEYTKTENGLPVCDPNKAGFIGKTCKPAPRRPAGGATAPAQEKGE